MSSSNQQRGVTMDDWKELLQADWKFPAHYKTKGAFLWRVFDLEHRYPESPNRIRGDASELLGRFALMRHFIELSVVGIAELVSECRSYAACCFVVDLILAAKQGVVDVTSAAVRDRMQDAISAHLTCHMVAYGTGSIKPKHHLNHCLPRQFWRKRRVTDAFFMERLHLRVKPHAELMKNTATFELSVLGRVIQKTNFNAEGWLDKERVEGPHRREHSARRACVYFNGLCFAESIRGRCCLRAARLGGRGVRTNYKR